MHMEERFLLKYLEPMIKRKNPENFYYWPLEATSKDTVFFFILVIFVLVLIFNLPWAPLQRQQIHAYSQSYSIPTTFTQQSYYWDHKATKQVNIFLKNEQTSKRQFMTRTTEFVHVYLPVFHSSHCCKSMLKNHMQF